MSDILAKRANQQKKWHIIAKLGLRKIIGGESPLALGVRAERSNQALEARGPTPNTLVVGIVYTHSIPKILNV